MSAENGPALLSHLREQKPRMIEFLHDLTVTESPSSSQDALRLASGVLANRFEQLGYHTLRAASLHLYARPRTRQRERPVQLLIGHYDTVWPLGTLHEMPFSVDGSIVRGPGVFDMKGGLTQIFFALEALQTLQLEPSLTPVIFVNADEEIGSRTSTRYITKLAKLAQRAYVLEPSLGPEGKLKTRRKGIGRYTITVFGKAAHAGLDPTGGASAILELSHQIQSLFALNDLERGITVNVGTVDGGVQPNVIAPHSEAVVDVRVATAEDAEYVDNAIRNLKPATDGVRVHAEGGIGRPALEQTPRNHALLQMARQLGAGIGLDIEEGMAGGGSDGNTTSLYTATLDGLGPVGDGAHARHEFLDIDKTIERAALLALLIQAGPELQEV
ncbi:MAG: M20 family metallopeptidase [Gammaproteobacteria bacterium]|nr:M20 family metallopeptidase [Gammaproteobacteria bacterium]NNF60660.1 M20 family metallopeptidase [Gammaproteobacteria bacterium]